MCQSSHSNSTSLYTSCEYRWLRGFLSSEYCAWSMPKCTDFRKTFSERWKQYRLNPNSEIGLRNTPLIRQITKWCNMVPAPRDNRLSKHHGNGRDCNGFRRNSFTSVERARDRHVALMWMRWWRACRREEREQLSTLSSFAIWTSKFNLCSWPQHWNSPSCNMNTEQPRMMLLQTMF